MTEVKLFRVEIHTVFFAWAKDQDEASDRVKDAIRDAGLDVQVFPVEEPEKETFIDKWGQKSPVYGPAAKAEA